jgi:hypothetical protein
MHTGSGKTMLPTITSQLESDNVNAIVLPLKSPMNDDQSRLDQMGIHYKQFHGQETRHLTGCHNIILVSADMVKRMHWKVCLAELNKCKPVVYTMFNEAQFAFTVNDYQVALQDLYDPCLFPMHVWLNSPKIATSTLDPMPTIPSSQMRAMLPC